MKRKKEKSAMNAETLEFQMSRFSGENKKDDMQKVLEKRFYVSINLDIM